MKIKGVLKRGLSIAMVLSMAASVLIGCGNSKKKNEESVLQTQGAVSKDYMYKCEDIKLDGVNVEDGRVIGISQVGEKINLALLIDDEKLQIASFNPDGSGVESYDIPVKKGEDFSNVDFIPDGGFYAYRTVNKSSGDGTGAEASVEADAAASAEASDGKQDTTAESASEVSSEAAAEATSDTSSESASEESSEEISDEGLMTAMEMYGIKNNDIYIEQYDAQGKLVNSCNCSEAEGGENDSYLFSVAATSDGKIYTTSSNGIQSFTFEDGFKSVIDTTQADSKYKDYYFRLYKGSDDQLYAYDYSNTNMVYKFDTAKGDLADPVEAIKPMVDYSADFFGGNGCDLYLSTADAIYGYNAEKNEAVKLIDYLDSSIELDNGINTIVALSENEFIAAIPGFDRVYSLVRLTKIPADQVKDKKVITLGGIGIDWRVREEAVLFNRQNDEYQIKIVDYTDGLNLSDPASEETAMQNFDMDLVSGNVPDIMVFLDNQPYKKYESKGLFYDYKPLFEKDEELKDVKLLPNLEKAMTTDGKMYTLFTEFRIGTVRTAEKYAGGKDTFSYQDCEDIISQKGISYDTAFGPVDRNQVLEKGVIYSGEKFLDFENKKCSFDSEDFIKLLEFAGKFPETVDYEKFGDDAYTLYASGQSLFDYDEFFGYTDYQSCKQAIIGDEIAFIGSPNDDGINNSVIIPGWRYAISSQCKTPEVAWDFVKRFWMKDFSNKRLYEWGFSVTEYGLKLAAEKAMDYPYTLMPGGKKERYIESYFVNGSEVQLKPLKQEEVDRVTKFVNSVDKVAVNNSEIKKMIFEEAPAYFSGQKSAEEVAKIIQNRATTYINENS